MRPLLASLALLLLALSRPIDSQNEEPPKDVRNLILGVVPDAQKPAVKAKMGDIYSLLLAFPALKNPAGVASIKKILDNGVQCTFDDDPNLAATLTTAMYDTGVRASGEDEIAKNAGIDCAVTAASLEWVCYCSTQTTIFFCMPQKYKNTITSTKGKCKKEALAELIAAGPTLGKAFDYAEMAKLETNSAFLTAMKAVLTAEDKAIDKIIAAIPEAVKFFCDAKKPEVETKVKALFASDIAFSMIDFYIVTGAVGKEVVDSSEETCKNDAAFKSTSFGSCICGEELGTLFCMYKELAKTFDNGFLDCAGNKFVDAKKPAPPKMFPNSNPGPQPDPAPRPVPPVPRPEPPVPGPDSNPTTTPNPNPTPGPDPAPEITVGGDTTTTTAPPDAAATCSLLVPLIAAAAMLLRH